MYCVQCGAEAPDSAKFCYRCGHLLVSPPSQPMAADPPSEGLVAEPVKRWRRCRIELQQASSPLFKEPKWVFEATASGFWSGGPIDRSRPFAARRKIHAESAVAVSGTAANAAWRNLYATLIAAGWRDEDPKERGYRRRLRRPANWPKQPAGTTHNVPNIVADERIEAEHRRFTAAADQAATRRDLVRSLVIAVCGAIVTGGTYFLAAPEGSYIVAYGALLVGGLGVLGALRRIVLGR